MPTINKMIQKQIRQSYVVSLPPQEGRFIVARMSKKYRLWEEAQKIKRARIVEKAKQNSTYYEQPIEILTNASI